LPDRFLLGYNDGTYVHATDTYPGKLGTRYEDAVGKGSAIFRRRPQVDRVGALRDEVNHRFGGCRQVALVDTPDMWTVTFRGMSTSDLYGPNCPILRGGI
jgi:hypothetical protein